MRTNFEMGLVIPKVIIKEILKYVDPATIYHLNVINKYFRNLVLTDYKTILTNSFLEIIIKSDNSELLLIYEDSLLKRAGLHSCKLDCVRQNSIKCLKVLQAWSSSWPEATCRVALESGSFECLKYAHEHSCRMDGSFYELAIRGGHVNCLEHIDVICHHRDIQSFACRLASYYGQLECLTYAHKKGYDWDTITCEHAALGGHLSCLKYAHENGCPWNESTCTAAAENGKFDCLKYAHISGCPWTEETCIKALLKEQYDCFWYAYKNGCPCGDNLFHLASCVKNKNFNICELLEDQRCPRSPHIITSLSGHEHINAIDHARALGFPWNEYACLQAVQSNSLFCLKHLVETGCSINVRECLCLALKPRASGPLNVDIILYLSDYLREHRDALMRG